MYVTCKIHTIGLPVSDTLYYYTSWFSKVKGIIHVKWQVLRFYVAYCTKYMNVLTILECKHNDFYLESNWVWTLQQCEG